MNEEPKTPAPPALGAKAPDHVAALIRSVVGAVPFAGSALAEVVTAIVPNQRIERLEKYLLFLQEELTARGVDGSDEKIKRPENVDLIEDGAYQAVRALTDDRKRYIARCVADGITADETDKIREKRVLGILAQLDDEEILILDAYGSIMYDRGEKFQKLRPEPAFMGSSKDVLTKNALYDAALDKLESVSLIRRRISMNRDAEKKLGLKVPEFDQFSGQPKGSREITSLGRLVLEKIGLLKDDRI